MRKKQECASAVCIVVEMNGFGLILSRRQRVDLGAPPYTCKKYSREGNICDLQIVNRSIDEERKILLQPST